MVKEGKIIQMIAEVAEQGTAQNLELEVKLYQVRDDLRGELYKVRDELRVEIYQVRDELKQDFRQELKAEIGGLRNELYEVRSELKEDLAVFRRENMILMDQIIGFLKRAEEERAFMSAHLKRLDEKVERHEIALFGKPSMRGRVSGAVA